MTDKQKIEELVALVKEMYALLQKYCDIEDRNNCLMWPDHNKQCLLRDIEDKIFVLHEYDVL